MISMVTVPLHSPWLVAMFYLPNLHLNNSKESFSLLFTSKTEVNVDIHSYDSYILSLCLYIALINSKFSLKYQKEVFFFAFYQ